MDGKARIKAHVATYLGLTVLFCLPPYYWCIHTGNLGGGYKPVGFSLILMWGPALAALATCRLRSIPLDALGWNWRPTKYQWIAYGVPILYSGAAYIGIWLTGKGGFYNREFVANVAKGFGWSLPDGLVIVLFTLLAGTFGMARSLSSALGEEIGWRGFLTPQLAKFNSYTATSLWMGLIWSLYHYPILLFSNYNLGGPKWFSLTCFSVMVFAMCFVLTWLRMKSGSLWTGAILHASHNLFIQQIFTPLTVDTGHTNYYIDEFGLGLPIVTVVVAIYFWRKRHELPETAQ
ncbi:CPBP family intramembrane metalloprotease [Pendulispora brunnea]|uniref:CPBP family intramembrane metalloprotease n=1 Tax=Pendulispora brunnea TaxID=2905690 RepID=A0ABZ2JW43_9BACT